jgi:hypothetical protein
MSHPRLFIVCITIVRLEVGDVEGIAHHVLGGGDVDDVCVIVGALEYLVWTISTGLQFGIAFFRKAVLAEV